MNLSQNTVILNGAARNEPRSEEPRVMSERPFLNSRDPSTARRRAFAPAALRWMTGDLKGSFRPKNSPVCFGPQNNCTWISFASGQEHEPLLELELLSKNTEHIEEIASMQQKHARVAHFAEPMPSDLSVEDALRMTAFKLQRRAAFPPGLPLSQMEVTA